MKNFIILIFICIQFEAFAQCPQLSIPKSGKTIQSFVPKGRFIKDSTSGDFNNDNLADAVLVLAHENEENEEIGNYECTRPLIILQKTRTGYILASSCKEAVLCKRCGGIFGEPFESITLNKNVLNVNHYAGSAWRWTRNSTFRFQNEKWELIGISYDSFFNASDCDGKGVGMAGRNLSEANFSTSKAHVIKTKESDCVPYKDAWIAFKKKPLITLQQFNINKDYFPLKNY